MKHRFLLDENIIFYAIRLEDEHDTSIPEAGEFITKAWENCHTIVLDGELNRRFIRHLETITINRSDFEIIQQGMWTVLQFFHHAEKCEVDWNELPLLPDESKYPNEDIHVVRAAAHFKVHVVTTDTELRDSINVSSYFQELGVRALTPKEALPLANET